MANLKPRCTHIDTQRFRFIPPNIWELQIFGWVLTPHHPIQDFKLFIGDKRANVVRRARAALIGKLPDVMHAEEGGFEARVEAEYFEGIKHELHIEARLSSGQILASKIALDLRNVRFEGEVQAESKDL